MSHTSDPQHQTLRENLAAYALGALEADESSELEAHLERCDVCRAELRWLQPAIDILPASVEQRRPPARLKRELMSVVEREADEARRADSRPGLFDRILGPARRPALALATVLLVLVGVAVGVLASQNEDGPSDTPTTTIQARDLGSAGDGFDASFAVTDPVDGGVLEIDHIDPVDRGHVYQLWVQRDGGVQPSATFVPRRDGSAEAAVTQSLDGADAVLMTREPRGGSKRPSTPAFASVALGST